MPRLGDAAPLDGLASATPTSTARQIEITDIQERRREKWLCSLFLVRTISLLTPAPGRWSQRPETYSHTHVRSSGEARSADLTVTQLRLLHDVGYDVAMMLP